MSAQRSEALMDAAQAAAEFGCSERQMVDRVSKRPGFPQPTKFRPLLWVAWKVIEFRDSSPALPPVRRRSSRSKA